MHVCPMFDGPKPHVGGPIIPPCATTVLTCKLPQARLTDMCTCVGPPDMIVSPGAPTVLVMKLPAARMGDMTAHGGVIVLGCFTVLIGNAGGGAPSIQVGTAITIEGDLAFQQATVSALADIMKTPAGAKMLSDLESSGKKVKIVPTTGGNAVGYDSVTNASVGPDGKPGSGSNSTIKFNPTKTTVGSGTESWQNRPTGVGLAHELVHSTHAAHGERDVTPVQNDHKPSTHPSGYDHFKKEEVRTVGIPPYDNEPYSENLIRSQWDPPQPSRPYY
ncbi:M91 family zinc metallopeptidase [Sphingomonas gilva]|uniref:M91 family zinc metallopeptidase n=1 Tax=Sphingomonas gilva TaxID=2305907 RepID=UPI001FE683D1|nr:M91 family zinc metallopeptidase [Sphingomonas gilva]